MKHIFILVACMLTLTNCTSSKNSEEITERVSKNMQPLPTILEVETATRGFYNQVVIANGVAIVKKTRDEVGVSHKLTSKQLQELTIAYNDFELDKINDYVSDSNLSSFDASTITAIKVTNKGDIYISNDFDTVNPPAAFKALVNCVNQIFNE